MGVSIADGVVAVAPKKIIAGTNVTTSETDTTVTINATGGGGGSSVWGGITGTLSDQTDLQTALNAKANTSSLATIATSGAYNDLSGKPTIPAQFNPIAGANMSITGTYPNMTFNSSGGGGGGGTTVTTGSAVINFGSVPGTNNVSVDVTGQATMLSGSVCKAYIPVSSTAEHNLIEHSIVPITLRCGNVVAGTGFTIYASTDWRLTGTFNVIWEWI